MFDRLINLMLWLKGQEKKVHEDAVRSASLGQSPGEGWREALTESYRKRGIVGRGSTLSDECPSAGSISVNIGSASGLGVGLGGGMVIDPVDGSIGVEVSPGVSIDLGGGYDSTPSDFSGGGGDFGGGGATGDF
jgi:hypothetical protein